MGSISEQIFLIKFFRESILKMDRKLFATKCNINPSTITRWETGSRNPSKTLVKKICDTFNLPDNAFYLNDATIRHFIKIFVAKNKDLKDYQKIDMLLSISKLEYNLYNKHTYLKLALGLSKKVFGNYHIKTIEILTSYMNTLKSPLEKIKILRKILKSYKNLNMKRFFVITAYGLSIEYYNINDVRNSKKYLKLAFNNIDKKYDKFFYYDLLILKAQILSKQKKYDSAIKIFKKLLDIYRKLSIRSDKTIVILNSLSICHFKNKNFSDVEIYINEGLELINFYTENKYLMSLKESLLYTLYLTKKREYKYNRSRKNYQILLNLRSNLNYLSQKTHNEKLQRLIHN